MMDINITKKDGTNNTVKMPNTIGYAITCGVMAMAYGAVVGFVEDVIDVFKKKK